MPPALAARLEFEMLHSIGDEDFAAIEARVRDRPIEEATGGTDERPTAQIFVIARLPANEHDRRRGPSLAPHAPGRMTVEGTTPAPGFRSREFAEGSDNILRHDCCPAADTESNAGPLNRVRR